MRLKGAVKFFAIALAVVCVFQLFFTFCANRLDKKAETYSNGNKEKKRHYIDSISHKTVFSIPFIRDYNYLDVKERELNLGLDLRGGMHVTLEVELHKLFKELSGNNNDPAFNKALAMARDEQVTSQRNFTDIFYDNYKKINPNVKLASIFATQSNNEDIKFTSSNDEVVAFLKKSSGIAVDNTYKILHTRIDKFGVTQPNVNLDANAGRIMVELPGVDDQQRVRKLLQGSAKLEFYETYPLAETFKTLLEAQKVYVSELQTDKDTMKGADATEVASSGTMSHDDSLKNKARIDSQAIAKKKADSLKNKTADKNEHRLFDIIFPQLKDLNSVATSPILAMVPISDTAKINALYARPEISVLFPNDMKLRWEVKPSSREAGDVLSLISLKTTGIEGQPAVLTGEAVTDARQDIDPQTNSYIVSMRMSPQGADEWARITKRNIGKSVAIVLDDQVYSYPRVNGEISGGNSQISGNFSANDAKDLANVLQSGKLPVEVRIIEEAVVGPSMGQDAINSGLSSLLVGLLAIILFMVLYYNRSGWVANLALIINLFFITGVLASLNAALTLPGMAGIVLTLAMAVDANVLIFERVRDEMNLGKNLRMAIAEGFKHALSSIIDANIVTLLIGIILMSFGSGPVYGFAIVLVIGILTSLFSAILITRLIFDWLLARDSKITFGNKTTNSLFRGFNYDFVGKRKTFYVISGVVIGIGIVSLFTRGLNYGVDFKGGYAYVVKFDKAVNAPDVRNILTGPFKDAPEVKTYGDNQTLNIITSYMVNETGDSVDNKVKNTMLTSLQEKGYKPTVLSSVKVGSTIANDIKNSAFLSIFGSLLVIFIYIIVRFKRWQFALGATVALAHDVFFVLTIFSLFKDILPFNLDVDQAIVAALLTVCCYSMNDTVVVFDRIREYLNNNKKSPMEPLINDAINKTLSRTLITSFTIFVVVLVLFLFGGQVIKGFAFALLLGVIIGTYSSIFVATPIVIDFERKQVGE